MTTTLIPYHVNPNGISLFQKQDGPFSSWTGDKKKIPHEVKNFLSGRKIHQESTFTTKNNTLILQRLKAPIEDAGYTAITLKTAPKKALDSLKKVALSAFKNLSKKPTEKTHLYKYFSKAVQKENETQVKKIEETKKKFISAIDSKNYQEAERLSTSFSLKTLSTILPTKESTKKFLQSVQNCAASLKKNLRKEHAYTEQELIHLATFIHGRLKELSKTRQHFRRTKFGTVRSLLYDAKEKAVYILHKSKERSYEKDKKKEQPSGTSKIAKPVTQLLLNDTYTTLDAVELVPNKGDSPKEYVSNITSSADSIKEEHDFIERFLKKHNLDHLDCFPKTLKVFKYHKKVPRGYLKSISAIQRRGKDLSKAIEKKSISKKEILPIAEKLLFAVKTLHEKNQIHWDIKPGNILLQGKKVILTDFGMRFNGVKEIPPCTNDGYGTLLYSAPELEWTPPKDKMGFEFYEKAEAFAVGVTLYETFFQKDLDDLNLSKILRKIEAEQTIQPQPLLEIILGLLNPEPLDRITCAEAYEKIQEIV